uniref:SJCHGC05415 protein n=2 Tax=Schistosoma japonicum TaxID=6182 RepID=Q5DAU5_SCHJA|nr:SJCHGC05415 protein [Schistosoma japonicum]
MSGEACFAVEQYESEPDELFDPASQLLSKKSAERVARRFKNTGILETQEELAGLSHDDDDDDEEEEEDDDDDDCEGHCGRDGGGGETDSSGSNVDNDSSHTVDQEVLRVKQQEMEANDHHQQQHNNNNNVIDVDLKELIKNLRSQCTSSPNDKESGSDDEDLINKQVPLQLPFSTFGVSGARLTHLFAELRERANLDLFQVPQINAVINNNANTVSSTTGTGNNISNNNATAQSSLFDADALGDELERHERMLKEFDDFLSDFQNIEPFGIVRQAVPPDVTAATRQQHINNNPSNIATTLLTTDIRTAHPTVN